MSSCRQSVVAISSRCRPLSFLLLSTVLRQLRPEIRSMTSDAAKTLVQAFITCRLDYCNSLLFGVSNYLMQKVQWVQNVAARLISGTRRCEHITPTGVALACCSSKGGVQARVPIVHQSLAEQTPSYLASGIQLTTNTGRPQFRSASERMCRSTHTQRLRRQKFFYCRSSCVERLAITSAAGHELQPLQACTKRTLCLGYSRPRRTVTCFRVP